MGSAVAGAQSNKLDSGSEQLVLLGLARLHVKSFTPKNFESIQQELSLFDKRRLEVYSRGAYLKAFKHLRTLGLIQARGSYFLVASSPPFSCRCSMLLLHAPAEIFGRCLSAAYHVDVVTP